MCFNKFGLYRYKVSYRQAFVELVTNIFELNNEELTIPIPWLGLKENSEINRVKVDSQLAKLSNRGST